MLNRKVARNRLISRRPCWLQLEKLQSMGVGGGGGVELA